MAEVAATVRATQVRGLPEGSLTMKRDNRALSTFRETSPYATPPRVLVMAADADAAGAVALAEALDAAGAETEVRLSADPNRADCDHLHPDAVIVAGTRGYRVTRHHPILEGVLPVVA
jgi:hypothetical protein